MPEPSNSPSEQDVLILATSKTNEGVTVVGIDTNSGEWVRPVLSPESHTEPFPLPVENVYTGRDAFYKPLHLTRIPLKQPCPDGPHVENWLLDTSRRPKVLRQYNEGQARRFLDSKANGSLGKVVAGHDRSVCLIKPDSYEITAKKVDGDVRVTIDFMHDGGQYKGLVCHDLKLRNFARGYLHRHQSKEAVMQRQNFERNVGTHVYLVIGLTQMPNGKTWPACLAFHTLPAYPGDIDWRNL